MSWSLAKSALAACALAGVAMAGSESERAVRGYVLAGELLLFPTADQNLPAGWSVLPQGIQSENSTVLGMSGLSELTASEGQLVSLNSKPMPTGQTQLVLTNGERTVELGELSLATVDGKWMLLSTGVMAGRPVFEVVTESQTFTLRNDEFILAGELVLSDAARAELGIDSTEARQSLGAVTAAEQGAIYFENIVNEQSANPRMLIVHEVMGRNCGWLTAYTAKVYRERLMHPDFLPGFNLAPEHHDVDAVYVPEMAIDLEAEAQRLRKVMDEQDCVNIFVSEGAGVAQIVKEMASRGEEVPRDAFGHYKLDAVNVGNWFSKQFAKQLGAEKALVQKSGYFARSAAANIDDQRLIKSMVDHAVECGLRGEPGVIGHDEDRDGRLRAIEFPRIKGGKPFDIDQPWFKEMLVQIGQPMGGKVVVGH